MIKAHIVLRMTKEEVEKVILPQLHLPKGAYHYWYNNELVVVQPMPPPLSRREGPVLIALGAIHVEIVDKVDSEYNDFSDIILCTCENCRPT